MNLSWCHDLSYGFNKLSRVDSSCFFSVFFNRFFFDFIFQQWIGWKLGFIIIFLICFYVGLFQSYDLGHRYDKLTWLTLFIFFGSFFNWMFFKYGFVIFFIYFLWGYPDLITHVMNFVGWLELTWFIFLDSFLMDFFFQSYPPTT
jgi:hypothetical protein